jgi:hypothetical protein
MIAGVCAPVSRRQSASEEQGRRCIVSQARGSTCLNFCLGTNARGPLFLRPAEHDTQREPTDHERQCASRAS